MSGLTANRLRHDSLLAARADAIERLTWEAPSTSIVELLERLRLEGETFGRARLLQIVKELEARGVLRTEIRSDGRYGRRTFVLGRVGSHA